MAVNHICPEFARNPKFPKIQSYSCECHTTKNTIHCYNDEPPLSSRVRNQRVNFASDLPFERSFLFLLLSTQSLTCETTSLGSNSLTLSESVSMTKGDIPVSIARCRVGRIPTHSEWYKILSQFNIQVKESIPFQIQNSGHDSGPFKIPIGIIPN